MDRCYERYAATVAVAGMLAGGWTLLPAAATHHSSPHSTAAPAPWSLVTPPTALLLHSTQEAGRTPISRHQWLHFNYNVSYFVSKLKTMIDIFPRT